MRKLAVLAVAALALTGCANNFFEAGNKAKPEFVYIGCHTVTSDVPYKGEVAFGPFGLKTHYVFFKQVNGDGSVSAPNTAKPCD